jgi:hypothetical protein
MRGAVFNGGTKKNALKMSIRLRERNRFGGYRAMNKHLKGLHYHSVMQ